MIKEIYKVELRIWLKKTRHPNTSFGRFHEKKLLEKSQHCDFKGPPGQSSRTPGNYFG